MHSCLNYANLAWGSIQKTRLPTLCCQQKHPISSSRSAYTTPDLFFSKAVRYGKVGICNCNGPRSFNHLVCERTLNHLNG